MNNPADEQQALLENSLPATFEAYDVAVEAGIAQPVVFLLDCEDAIGGEIARSWLGEEAVAEAMGEQPPGEDSTTVFAHAFSWDQCRQEVPAVFPYLQSVFEQQQPDDGFLAVSVTAEGASALTVPFAARPEDEIS